MECKVFFRRGVLCDKWDAKLFCFLRVFSGRRKPCATDAAVGLCFLVSQNQRIVWFAVGCLRSSFAVVIGIGMILVVAVSRSDSLPTSPNESLIFKNMGMSTGSPRKWHAGSWTVEQCARCVRSPVSTHKCRTRTDDKPPDEARQLLQDLGESPACHWLNLRKHLTVADAVAILKILRGHSDWPR